MEIQQYQQYQHQSRIAKAMKKVGGLESSAAYTGSTHGSTYGLSNEITKLNNRRFISSIITEPSQPTSHSNKILASVVSTCSATISCPAVAMRWRVI